MKAQTMREAMETAARIAVHAACWPPDSMTETMRDRYAIAFTLMGTLAA